MKFFDTSSRGVRSIFCGATYSLAINDIGVLYLFGQNKKTGEANMYPKPVQDLSGWHITSIGCSNTSIVISADDTVIAWGASPTFGELVWVVILCWNLLKLMNITHFNYSITHAGFGWLTKVKHHTKRGQQDGRHENSTGDHGFGPHNAIGQHGGWGNKREILENAGILIGRWLEDFMHATNTHTHPNVFLRQQPQQQLKYRHLALSPMRRNGCHTIRWTKYSNNRINLE